MIEKPKTSFELMSEEYAWPMTAGEVSRLTGVTRRALRHYDKEGLLKVARTGEFVANDRKLYYPADVERLKRIMVLTTYGFQLSEVAVILDGDMSVADALSMRLEELRQQERRIRNLIMFAHFAALVGDDVFETLAFGTSDIDAFAEAVRGTERFRAYLARQEVLSEEELDALWSRYCDVVEDFLEIDGELSFAAMELLVDRLRQWFGDAYYPADEGDLLSLWTLFADGADAAELAEEIGGVGTAGFLQATVFFVWAKRTLAGLAELCAATGEVASEAPLGDAVRDYLVRRVGLGEGWMELAFDPDERSAFCDTVLGYLAKLIGDEDAMELMGLGDEADAYRECLGRLLVCADERAGVRR